MVLERILLFPNINHLPINFLVVQMDNLMLEISSICENEKSLLHICSQIYQKIKLITCNI